MLDQTTFLNILIMLAVIILPFTAGAMLARRWRLNDYGWQIGLILFALAAGGVIVTQGLTNPKGIKLGIDLRGGAILVYEVEAPPQEAEAKEAGETPKIEIGKVVEAIQRRVNPGGVKEVSVRPFGERQVEIIIPEADQAEVDRIERQISRAGTLEFRILASRRDSRHDRVVEQSQKARGDFVRIDDRVAGRWVPVVNDPKEESNIEGNPEFVTRRDPKGRLQVLVVVERSEPVTGAYLTKAVPDFDEAGRPAVAFGFNAVGARLFGRLTDENLPEQDGRLRRHLGIILDGHLNSAPTIENRISDRGIIHGNFSQQEVDDLVAVLRAGSLPATLSEEPISSLLIGPTLGADTIERGKWAMIASVLVTVVFMIIYYRFSGLVASAAVLTNVLLTVAIMIVIKATFTLPGLAGLALTVGMSVDANVLIYERIREELVRGAALRMAIRNGFGRAMSAIVDSNITTLMTAVVLYVLGTDQVRGFAVTLFLGISVSLFTSVFCARVVFEVAERNGWIKRLKMMQAIKPTNFDFVSTYRTALIGTCVVAVVGVAALFARGYNMLDIDFTSGSSIQLQFDPAHPQSVADVRRDAQQVLPPGLIVSQLSISGERSGLHFLLNTSDPDIEHVEDLLKKQFGDKLARNQATITEVAEIDTSEQPKAGESSPSGGAEPSGSPAPAAAPQESETNPAPQTPAPGTEENKAPDTPAPKPEGQTRAGAADERLVALADDRLVVALLGQEPAKTAAETPKSDAAAPAQAEGQQPAPPSPPPQEQSAQPSATPAESPTEPAPGAAASTGGVVLPAGPTTIAKLQFKQPVDHETLRDVFRQIIPDMEVSLTNPEYTEGSGIPYSDWDVQIPLPRSEAEPALVKVQAKFAQDVFFPSASKIGATVAANTRQQAILAVLASMILIVIYIWVRFQNVSFGLAAVIAVFVDVVITLGALAVSYYIAPFTSFLLIEPFKINLTIVAAFLTIIGYSINDKIVVFDRIREVRGKSPLVTPEMVNLSVNQTLSRTLLTGTTTILVLLILYATGGDAIHGFAFSLLIGVLVGTYTSIYIGTPILLWMMKPARQQKPSDEARSPKALPTGTR